LATTGGQIGTVVTVTDQAGRQRRSITNALGQLKRVDEPNDSNQLGTIDSPNQATNYSYDTLNNLTTVSQGVQTRSFVYDSLSRLKQATNPESGLIQYNYDNNGNLTSKIDARNITTSYVYDNLNRVKTRSYSDTTPAVSYFYDNLTNAKGKLIKVSSSVSTTEYSSFDSFGRLLAHKQTTDGQTYNSSYSYNLSGALIEETYPSGRVVKNTLNLDGDLSQVQSRKANDTFKNYANSFNYTAAGAVSSMRLGNGKWENTQFNSRLQPIQIGLGSSATSQNLLKLNFDYGGTDNNGNVKSQTITVPTIGANTGFTAIQTYTYDSLNRLKDAKEMIGTTQTWKQTFLYDRYGNRRFDTANNNTTTLPTNCAVAVCNPQIDPTTNRLIGSQFDASGNTKIDANGQTFTYDAENKQVQVSNSSGIVGQYFYDGDGKRVKKIVPSTGETTIFVYDASGKMVAEYSTAVASTSEAKVSYLTSDHLGSPRINTDQNGQVIARHDYQPFGEEIQRASYGADSTRQKFTG
jgi:YD repeat-containing protein